MPALQMYHAEDPRDALRRDTAPFLDDITPLGPEVLIAVYMRPNVTKGGIHLADTTRDEDKWQGKVGLVLKIGELAFCGDDNHVWGSVTPKVGDWVVFRVGDTWSIDIGKHRCRFVEDVHIKAIIAKPDAVL